MERAKGFEASTPTLARLCSTCWPGPGPAASAFEGKIAREAGVTLRTAQLVKRVRSLYVLDPRCRIDPSKRAGYGRPDRHHGEIQPSQRRPCRRRFSLRRRPRGRGPFARPARAGGCCARLEEGGNKAAKLRAIREALRTAKRVWLATDCDREGQLIGQEILEHYEYHGQVMRVLFTAQDSQTIRDAFSRAKPNAEYARLYAAAVARRQADQIYNLSLTRTATVILGQGARRVIGVGRVKTPTLAIVCRRESEIRNFMPIAYFEVVATAKVAGGQFQMRHAPQDRIVRREIAQGVVNAAQDFEGPLAVRVEDKRQGPPKLHDLPSLQKLCGSRF